MLGKEEELGAKAQEFVKLESERLRGAEELRAVASFWKEKWQGAAVSLASAQRELEAAKQQDPGRQVRLVCGSLHVQTLLCTPKQNKSFPLLRVLLNILTKIAINETYECPPFISAAALSLG